MTLTTGAAVFGGVWAGMCLQRKQGKRQVRMALFNVPGPSCAAAISSKQAVLSSPKSTTLWEKSVCLWKSMSTNVLNYASVCLQSPISWCSPIMVLTFHFYFIFFSFTFWTCFISLPPSSFFRSLHLHLLYLLPTPHAPCNSVGGGDTSREAKWGSFRYASARQERLGCQNESAERNKREGSKDMMKVQHEKEPWTNRLATTVALTQLMFNSSENWSCSK